MAITPWFKPAELSITPLPFEAIAQAGLMKQKRLDTELEGVANITATLGTLKSATFDVEHKDAIQKEYNNDVMRITDLLMQDDPNAHKELLGLKSKLTMDSRLTTLQNNYNAEVLHDTDKANMLKDKEKPYRFWNDPLVPFLQDRKANNNPLTPFKYEGIEAHTNPYDIASKIVGNIAETQLSKDGWKKDPSDPLGLRYFDTKGQVGIVDDKRFQNIIESSIPLFLQEPGGRSYVKELQYAWGVSDPKQIQNEVRQYLKDVAYKQLHVKGGGYSVGHLPDAYKVNPYANVVQQTPALTVTGETKLDPSIFDLQTAGTTVPYTMAEAEALKKNFIMSDPGDRSAYAGVIAAGKKITTSGYKDLSSLSKDQQQKLYKLANTLRNAPEYKALVEKFITDPTSLNNDERGKLYKAMKGMNENLGKSLEWNSSVLPFKDATEQKFVQSMFGVDDGNALTTNKLGTGWGVNTTFMDEKGKILDYPAFIEAAKKLDPDGTSLVTISGKLMGDNAADLVDGGTRFSNGYHLSIKGHQFFTTGVESFNMNDNIGRDLEFQRQKQSVVSDINKAKLHPNVNRTIDYFGHPVDVAYDDNTRTFFIASYDNKTDFPYKLIGDIQLKGYSAADLEQKILDLSKKLSK